MEILKNIGKCLLLFGTFLYTLFFIVGVEWVVSKGFWFTTACTIILLTLYVLCFYFIDEEEAKDIIPFSKYFTEKDEKK